MAERLYVNGRFISNRRFCNSFLQFCRSNSDRSTFLFSITKVIYSFDKTACLHTCCSVYFCIICKNRELYGDGKCVIVLSSCLFNRRWSSDDRDNDIFSKHLFSIRKEEKGCTKARRNRLFRHFTSFIN